jgi:hypothetical protein
MRDAFMNDLREEIKELTHANIVRDNVPFFFCVEHGGNGYN